MEQWYAIIKKEDRTLVSIGTVLADPMPPDLMIIPIPEYPTLPSFWNPETLKFELKPEGRRN